MSCLICFSGRSRIFERGVADLTEQYRNNRRQSRLSDSFVHLLTPPPPTSSLDPLRVLSFLRLSLSLLWLCNGSGSLHAAKHVNKSTNRKLTGIRIIRLTRSCTPVQLLWWGIKTFHGKTIGNWNLFTTKLKLKKRLKLHLFVKQRNCSKQQGPQ